MVSYYQKNVHGNTSILILCKIIDNELKMLKPNLCGAEKNDNEIFLNMCRLIGSKHCFQVRKFKYLENSPSFQTIPSYNYWNNFYFNSLY